jgi:hypothetical protein
MENRAVVEIFATRGTRAAAGGFPRIANARERGDKYITLRKDYNPDIVDYEAYVQGYKQQGLYPNSNIDFSNRINAMASTANLPYSQFSMYIPPHPRAHLFYKIPRKW